MFGACVVCCLKKKKASDKENLLLPKPTSILDKVGLGCFSLLGLEISADFSAKKVVDKENLLLQLPLNRFKDSKNRLRQK